MLGLLSPWCDEARQMGCYPTGVVGAWVLGLAMVALAGQLEHLNFDSICVITVKECKQWCLPAPVDLERVPVAVPLFDRCSKVRKWLFFTYCLVTF